MKRAASATTCRGCKVQVRTCLLHVNVTYGKTFSIEKQKERAMKCMQQLQESGVKHGMGRSEVKS